MTSARAKSYFLLLLVALIWGIAGPVIKYTLGAIDPLPFVTYRFFISSLIGIFFIFISRHHLKKIFSNFTFVFLYGIFSTTISLGLLFLGMDKTSMLDTILISAISPLITAEFGVWFLKEKMTRQEKLGITLAVVGTVITMIGPILKDGLSVNQLSGNILIFIYLFTNSIAAIFSKKLTRKEVDSFTLSNVSFIIGFLTILPVTLLSTGMTELTTEISTLPFKYHLGVLYMALFSGTIAYALWVRGQKSIEVSEAGIFGYLTPLFQAPLAVLWLGEVLTWEFVIGGIIIALGVFIAEYKRRLTVNKSKKNILINKLTKE